MQEFNEIQRHIDELTMTTGEERHAQQQRAADMAKRIEMERKREIDSLRKALAATDKLGLDGLGGSSVRGKEE